MATKFAALLWRTKPESVVKACQASVNRLGGKPIDLYQIHFPNAYANAKYWDGFAMAYEKCLVQAGGGSQTMMSTPSCLPCKKSQVITVARRMPTCRRLRSIGAAPRVPFRFQGPQLAPSPIQLWGLGVGHESARSETFGSSGFIFLR
jgi:hypothetical protein